MGAFSKFMKDKNRNLYIGVGLVIILLAALAWFYYNKSKDVQHDLEEESELIRAASDSAAPPQQPPASKPKETFAAPSKPAARPAIVLFHSSTCPNCSSIMTVWPQLKEQIGKEVDVMDFEARKEFEILQQNGIENVPEVRYYPKGFPGQEFVDYKTMPGANRQLDSLIRFAMSHGQTA